MESVKDIFELIDELECSGLSDELKSKNINYYLQEKARECGIPYHGHFELTPFCNLNCKMCYVHLQKDQVTERSILTSKDWIELMQQSIDAGMLVSSLSGGECLTYPWFDEVYMYLKSKGMMITVLTNGVLLNNKRIEFFKKNLPNIIQVSLYGYSEETYEKVTGNRVFDTVVNNIIKAKEAGLPIRLSITPNRYISGDIKKVIKLAFDLDLPYTINLGLMTPRSDTGRQLNDHDISLDDYIEVFKYNRALNNEVVKSQKIVPFVKTLKQEFSESGLKCGAGRSVFSINWDGTMSPCSQMNSILTHPREVGFLNAWNDINQKASKYPRFKQCDECVYSKACNFCAAENEKMGSRYLLDVRWCQKTWKMVENGLRKIELICD